MLSVDEAIKRELCYIGSLRKDSWKGLEIEYIKETREQLNYITIKELCMQKRTKGPERTMEHVQVN